MFSYDRHQQQQHSLMAQQISDSVTAAVVSVAAAAARPALVADRATKDKICLRTEVFYLIPGLPWR